jgi:peptide deformylase
MAETELSSERAAPSDERPQRSAPDPEADGEQHEPDATSGEPELDPELAERRRAALAHVRKWGDPILREKARRVERFDEALRQEVERMGRLMHDAMGVGLAATQVGVLHRVLVYRVQGDGPIAALVNPAIEWRGREEEFAEEGCLSLPRVLVEVPRAVHIRVHAQDEDGEELVVEASGFEARVIQHEIDHLDGVLILNRTSREQKKQAVRTLREWQASAGVA